MALDIRSVSLRYTPETWKRLAAIPEARVEMSYSDYVRNTEKIMRDLAAHGIAAEKNLIDIDRMIAWCRRNGYEIDGKGRSIYGTMLQMARDDPDAMNAPVDDPTRVIQ